MSEYPSLIDTNRRIINLYLNTIFEVLPCSLLIAIMHYLFKHHYVSNNIKLVVGYPIAITHSSLISAAEMLIYYLIAAFVFSVALYGMYQKYQQEPFHYGEVMMKSGPRVLQMILATLILSIPLAPIGLLMFIFISASDVRVQTSVQSGHAMGGLVFALIAIIGLIIVTAFIYINVAPVLIVAKGKNAWQGLKQSCHLVSGHWVLTLRLVSNIVVAMILISGLLSKLDTGFTIEIIILLSFSFVISMMIIHCDNLEKLNLEEPVILKKAIRYCI